VGRTVSVKFLAKLRGRAYWDYFCPRCGTMLKPKSFFGSGIVHPKGKIRCENEGLAFKDPDPEIVFDLERL
jgi:hypothetical protein